MNYLRGLVALALMSACATNDPSSECETDADCPGKESCVHGECWELCSQDTHCLGHCDGTVTDGTTCINGVCVAGECEIDPDCEGIVCDSPPDATCFNASTLRTHQASGVCAGGDCTYAIASDQNCPGGCIGTTCDLIDLCSGIACDTPPAQSCESRTKTTHSSPGTCSDGDCTYAESTVDCTWMCEGTGCLSDSSYTVDCGGTAGYGIYSSIEALLAAANGESSAIHVNGQSVHTGFGPAIQCTATAN